jgi:hypothetical protein
MPEWWPSLLIGIVCLVLFFSLIAGLVDLVKDLKLQSARVVVLSLLSLLILPAMFSSCAAINHYGDEQKDALGFEYADLEKRSGFSTRSQRRERLVENAFAHITSSHGIASIVLSLLAASPFLLCLYLLNKEMMGYFPNGWLPVTVVLGIVFLVIYGRTTS